MKDVPSPHSQLIWVTPFGKIVNIESRVKAEWVYYSENEPTPSSGLHLKYWIELPPGYMIKNKRSSSQTMDAFPVGTSPFDKNSGYVFAVIAKEQISHFAMQLQKSESHPLQTLDLVITSKMPKTTLSLDPTCKDLGVSASHVKKTQETSLVYMVCQQNTDKGGIDVFTLYSKDFKISATEGVQDKNQGKGWSVFHLQPTLKSGVTPTFELVPTESEDASSDLYTFSVMEPFESNKRFGLSGGLGGTWASYNEVPFKPTTKSPVIKMSQTAITGKLNASYQLNSAFNVSGNVFLTLLPITRAPPSAKSHRTLGSSLRFGYLLPFKTKLSWKVSAGAYYWKMIVPSNVYGVSVVATQIFLEALGSFRSNKNYYAYIKVSPITSSGNLINTSNRELAVGGGFQLSRPGEKKPWFATIDFADFRFANSKRTYSLTSISLGVLRRF